MEPHRQLKITYPEHPGPRSRMHELRTSSSMSSKHCQEHDSWLNAMKSGCRPVRFSCSSPVFKLPACGAVAA